MSQLPHASQHTYHFVRRLIAALPRFELILGTNLDQIPGTIVELLRTSEPDTSWNRANVVADSINDPFISIIIFVHDGARLLPGAVDSVLAQNHAAIEIIVVDSGSSDDIDDVLARLPVEVRFFQQRCIRRAAAYNRGIREASGEFIGFLDVDALWPPGTLQTMFDKLLIDDTCDVVQGFGQLKKLEAEPANGRGSHKEALGDRLTAAIYRRKAFRRVGLFDQDLGFGEENDWYDRARRVGVKIRQVNGVTLLQRRESGETLEELNALRALKDALDQKREIDFQRE
jgi:glycosyltransferase involved in cell wall biosynthesis